MILSKRYTNHISQKVDNSNNLKEKIVMCKIL